MCCQVLHADAYLQSENDINIHKAIVDGRCAMHTHDFIEMFFVTSGGGIHTVNGKSYRVSKGDLFILNADIPHEFLADADAPLTVYNCLFQPASIDSAFTDSKNFVGIAYQYLFHALTNTAAPREYIKLTGINPREIERILEGIHEEYRLRQDGFKQIIRADLTKLLILVFRLYKNQDSPRENKPIFARIVVENTLSYMRRHYRENILCEQLAARSYVSPSYFSRIFQKEAGCSVIRALQTIRVEEACKLLEETVFSVDAIAARVGYSDRKHFYQVFRKITGQTPGRYRTEKRK